MAPTYIIVGAGIAGATAAATLRREGFDGKLILLGDEPSAPYERPPLSKEYLRGEEPFENALVHEPAFYEDHGIETQFGARATRVDPTEKMVWLDNDDLRHFDKVLIATGSRNRRPNMPGDHLEGVCQLRTIEDSRRIRSAARDSRKAVIIGMGFIGCEVAASLRQLGIEVTAVVPEVPLARILGTEVGRVIEQIHRDNGVEMLVGDSVVALEGSRRVERVITMTGSVIDCDFVVAGLGAEPVTDIVAGSGIEIDNGIVVDEYCRTNVEGIYAAGDVANHYHPVFERHIRVEHFDNAAKQGAAAARNMLDQQAPYDEVPWFWSDQYEYNLQYFGFAPEWDQLVVRGDLEQPNFVAFYLKEGRILASAGIDRGRDVRRTVPLIKARAIVSSSELASEKVDLRRLVA